MASSWERSFTALTAPRWKAFANCARLSEPAVPNGVVEMVDLLAGAEFEVADADGEVVHADDFDHWRFSRRKARFSELG